MKNVLLFALLTNVLIGTGYFGRVTWERFHGGSGLSLASVGSAGSVFTWSGASRKEVFKEPDREVPAPKGHPPLSIQIGKHNWSIKYASSRQMLAANDYAYENNETKTIWLIRQRSEQAVREDVIHEILHACFYEGGGSDEMITADQNSFVTPTAAVLRDVLVDNPELLKWLTE